MWKYLLCLNNIILLTYFFFLKMKEMPSEIPCEYSAIPSNIEQDSVEYWALPSWIVLEYSAEYCWILLGIAEYSHGISDIGE